MKIAKSVYSGMHKDGLGIGYETTAFEATAGRDVQRIAAFVFWRGGGFDRQKATGHAGRTLEVGVPRVQPNRSLTWRLSMPLRYLALAIFLPFAWVADLVLAFRRKPVPFIPMSAAMLRARATARYEGGVLEISAHKLEVPEHSTLIVFVEDDTSRFDGLSIKTHRMATEPFVPGPAIDPEDRERLLASRDPRLKQEIAQKLFMKQIRGPHQMFHAVHQDPVCREFIARAGGHGR
jgi:hypothetical protein